MYLRRFALLPLLFLMTAVLAACGDDDPAIRVEAEIVEDDAPAAVSVNAPSSDDAEDGTLAHEVHLTWTGEQAASLEDARFAHHVTEGDGDLVTAGRGCGASWDEAAESLQQACTDDLRIIILQPGETHRYPVALYREVGPLELRAGTYVVEEQIAWQHSDGSNDPPSDPDGTFTVRLTYHVE